MKLTHSLRIGVVAVLFLVFAACSGADLTEGGAADAGGPERQRAALRDVDSGGAGAGGTSAGGSGGKISAYSEGRPAGDQFAAAGLGDVPAGQVEETAPDPEPEPAVLGIGPQVIKTATVDISVKGDSLQEAVRSATTVAERYGGYVVSTSMDDEGKSFAAATLRVPSDKFATAMASVRGLGTVEREEISGEDVTQQVIDLEARLRNLRAQEVVLLRLMNDARTVLDTIRIQDHLSGVQLEIERIRGRLRYLDDQVSFSTIFVEMREAGAAPEPKLGTLGKAWQRAVDATLSVVSGLIVGAGFALPLAVLFLLALLAYRGLRPRFTRGVESGV